MMCDSVKKQQSRNFPVAREERHLAVTTQHATVAQLVYMSRWNYCQSTRGGIHAGRTVLD